VSIEGANNAACSFASPVPEIYFLEKKIFVIVLKELKKDQSLSFLF
jgi:hypothetical protein